MHEIGDPERLHPLLAVAGDLDQRELALDMRPLDGQIGDLVDRHELVEQRLDLLDHLRGAGGHDVDPRAAARAVDLRYGQAVDVVAAAREQADHPGQHARLVVDQDGDRVALLLLGRHRVSSVSSKRPSAAAGARLRPGVRAQRRASGAGQTSTMPSSEPCTGASSSGQSLISLCAAPPGIIG